jgi:proteasome lid subunit RPN8/RPN11
MAKEVDREDVAQLAKKDLSEAAFPGGGKADFRVYFPQAIHQRIAAHAAERLSLEICGVLVGHWRRDADGPFVLVEESIRCDKAVSNAGDVTFTHEAWNEVHHAMDTRFTDRDIVGWYHSHPNFGIFLSDRDCFIQEHFFNGPGQIAYVVDPVNGVEGVFAWRNGKSKLCPHFWVGNEIHLSSQGTAQKPSSASPADQSVASAPKADAQPPVSSMTWILGALCFLMLGYLVGSKLTAADRARSDFGAVAHYGDFKCLKLGMREELDQVDDALQKITRVVDTLASEHISLAGDAAKEKKERWSEVVLALLVTGKKVREINNLYSLTPEEAAEIQELKNAKEAELEHVRTKAAKDSAARNSGQAASAAKGEKSLPKSSSAQPSAPPPKTTALPAPAKASEVKPVGSAPAEANKKP